MRHPRTEALWTAVGAALIGSAGAAGQPGAGGQQAQPPAPSVTEPAAAPAPPTDGAAAEKKPDGPGGWNIDLTPWGSLTFRANVRNTPGDVMVWRAGVNLGVSGPLGDRTRLVLNLEDEGSWYDFHNATGLVPGTDTPLTDVYRMTLRPGLAWQQSDHLSWVGGAIIEFAGERDADLGDSATYGGYLWARYQLTPTMALTAGFGAKTRLEEHGLIVPLLGLEWDVSDKVKVTVRGLEARVAAKLNPALTFTLSGAWELREFRLADDNPLPSGVARDSRVPIAAGLEWRVCDHVMLALRGGAVVWQEFRFDDRDGNEVGKQRTDPAPFVMLSAQFTF